MDFQGSITAEANCSTANLGPGFDVFALALEKYRDRVHVRPTRIRSVRIRTIGPFREGVPSSAAKNSAGPPAQEFLDQSGEKIGVEITVEKNVPPGLGLGSSGATAAACAKAMKELLHISVLDGELVRIASLGEKAVSGSAHTDNVGASLLGGFVISYGEPLRIVSVKPPSGLSVVVVTPRVRLPKKKTGIARRLIPKKIPVRDAVLNVGRASAITLGFLKGDIELIGSGMEDAIAEPYREKLIPGYPAVKKAAIDAGASGVAISGAGPSIVALANRKENPTRIGRAMVREFRSNNTESSFFVTRPAGGARIVRS